VRASGVPRLAPAGTQLERDTVMRLSFLPPAELSAEQKPLYEEMKVGIAAKYSNFTTTRGDGAILGPWSAWLHDPDLGRALWEATKGMTRFRHLPEMIRQIVILVVGSKFGAAYEIYAHGAVAMSSGMSSHRLATIVANLRPADLTNEEGVAYDMTNALLKGGVLSPVIWESALAAFGKEGTREIVYLVGHYCFISMTLNGFAIPLPDED
jgi:4-carboxymuconolactone decarboxylase